MSSDKAEAKGSLISQGVSYLNDSVAELKKVSFPTKQETTQATMATVVIILFFAGCLVAFDFICHWVMERLT